MNRLRAFILFFPLLIHSSVFADTPGDTTDLEAKIHALHQKVVSEGRLTTVFRETDLASLPIGIVKEVGGKQYIIAIDQARYTPQGAFFDAYISLPVPFSKKPLAFKAQNVAFSPGGLAKSGMMRLTLASKHERDITSKIKLVLPAEGERNFIEWDCNGFKSVNLKGEFEFSRDMLISDDPQKEKVTATFEVNTGDPGSIITAVSITPFQVKTLKGFSFEVQEAIVDYSDIANPANIRFPKDYENDPQLSLLWQGFYLKKLSVTLPEELLTKNGRAKIAAENLIIDKAGVSGTFSATNIFNSETGTLDGWPLSVTDLSVTLLKGKLAGAGFKGELTLPIFEQPMGYEALIYEENNETNYMFSVQTGKSFRAPILGADIALDPTSFIKISKVEGRFRPEAILNGKASVKSGGVNFRELQFRDLHLATVKPYVRSGVWSLVGEKQEVADFPVSIRNIVVQHNQQIMKLTADVSLALMNKSDKGFGATTRVAVFGEIEEEVVTIGEETVTEQKWVYGGTNIDDIDIKVNGGCYALEGRLSLFDNDQVYGSGFRGQIKATFKPGPMVEATAQFGSVNGMRYWYADAKVKLPSPVGTGFGIYGFGGGMYYHMKMQKFDQVKLSDASTSGNHTLQVGKTQSGVVFVPDAAIGLGFRATVILGTIPSPKPFNGDATFEMAFNSSGGLRYVGFTGQGYFMTDMEKRSMEAPIFADLMMLYDFDNKTFHATLDTYVNAYGLIKGIHERGLAGSAVIHFSPEEWYIHIGTPDQRIGLEFVGLVRAGSYFMVGTNIPGMPAPPAQVSKILGDMDLDFMRDENALGSGAGFAFGTAMQVGTGKLRFLMFYGEFEAGLGFDIMLKNYGNAQCAGRSGPIGINGWYASGQAWAYVMGRIGIKVKLKFIKGEFDILRIGAAAVLQAKLPNPVYMQGVVGGEFSILGGLVKGKCRFKLTIGEECEIMGVSESTGIKVISDVSPTEGENEVSVFTTPQVAFTMSIGKAYEILDKENEFRSYRVKLDYFRVKHNGQALEGEIVWNDNKDVAIFKSFEILPPKAPVTAEVKVLWEEKISGSWKPLGGSNSQEYETETRQFRTSEAPKNIPEENVLYTYPAKGQYNFHKSEHNSNYITLKSGQAYLFKSTDEQGVKWKYQARLYSIHASHVVDVPVSYSNFSGRAGGEVTWAVPQQLQPETVYSIRILKVPADGKSLDSNVTFGADNIYEGDDTSVEVAKAKIEGTLALADDFVLYETYFRTSKYNTFSEKLAAATAEQSIAVFIEGWNLVKLGYSFDSDEILDQSEIYGWKGAKPLVQLEALTNNNWYKNHIYPHIYQHYPPDSEVIISDWKRSDRPQGIPPLRAMNIYQHNRELKVGENEVIGAAIPGTVYFTYDLEYYTYRDYHELTNKAINKYLDAGRSQPIGIKTLLDNRYTNLLSNQNYGFMIMYVLPGGKITTTRNYNIKF
ncbi:hypothetical protein C900_02320 [Fulvivirga imtechensis AK7]|uniref:TonB-dependent receptor n=1 Tax=Fulvivirga imtechensis AK7 TaxID=1237149 RepID=L8JSB8_9BACT|nr:hypothetical protein [Fulvivirga imtechensis]ELR71735.1 hypothetical protein C900_02320 [Fulvivirga imtechensis AK7]